MGKVSAKFKAEYKEKVAAMSNDELFAAYLEDSYPDDYDGCFTDHGSFCCETTYAELVKRLIAIGWLSEDYEEMDNCR